MQSKGNLMLYYLKLRTVNYSKPSNYTIFRVCEKTPIRSFDLLGYVKNTLFMFKL
jgi:hypothetical protein